MKSVSILVISIILNSIFMTECSLRLKKEQQMQMKSFYKDKKVLVTGGCGFIGSHLVEQLVAYGAQVTVLDNLHTGSLENIALVKDRITLYQESIESLDACLQATRNQDIIFHLAALISVAQSCIEPLSCHTVNVDGTVNILESLRINSIPALVFSSSAAVYGLHDGISQEDTTPCKPMSPYGLSKLIGEQYCEQYALQFGIHTACLRYFNVYGPRQNPHGQYAGARARFTYLMEQNKEITILGDGKQVRDFVSVFQVVEANLVLGMLTYNGTANHTICNVASGNSMNLLELIDTLKLEYPHYTGTISFAAPRSGDVRISQADCSRYKDLISMMEN
jgi:UDP-glucose 4-epimerase